MQGWDTGGVAHRVAILVHGWGASGEVWSRSKAPLRRLFRSLGYRVDAIDMPGGYTAPQIDFYYYAEYLAQKVAKHAFAGADEIVIVGHSMGGIAARLYVTENIGSPQAKSKVGRLITLATPHHGTAAYERELARIGIHAPDDVLSDHIDCYRQAKLASPFMQALNTPPQYQSDVELHSIWSRNDLAVVPTYTAVLPGARNYYIDSWQVWHMNIIHSTHTLRIVRGILDGTAETCGLQTYPPPQAADHRHLWFPAVDGNVRRYYRWRCRNQGCGATAVAIKRPALAGCGADGGRYRWHRWQRLEPRFQYRFECAVCHETVWHPGD